MNSRRYLSLSSKGNNVDPSRISIDVLRKIMGAIWTARLDIPYGPRPNQPDNILAMDYLSLYSPTDKIRMINKYKKDYTHYPTGPVIDVDGYHGKYPTKPNVPTQREWDAYLDDVQLCWNNQLIPVHFVHPDNWTIEDMAQLAFLYMQERAKKLLRIIIPTGWEPTRYGWKAQYWADIIRLVQSWMSNPPAPILYGIHTVTDTDAPTGDGDNFLNGNAGAWEIVAPLIHFWLIQNGPYNCNPKDDSELAGNFGDQFNPNIPHSIAAHLKKGFAGWPTYSAWGPNTPLDLIAAEQTSYEAFWNNLPEQDSRAWGNLALINGADGAFDGCGK